MLLNESGINKVVDYIGKDLCKYVSVNDRHLLLGMFNNSDITKLENVGIKLNSIGGGLHEVIFEDSTELDSTELDSTEPTAPVAKQAINDDELKQIADMMLPMLRQIFPTKDEVNEIINKLQAQTIDPDEMVDGLKMQIKRIDKQSKATDEVG
jgi:hypothetical protein